MDFQIMPIEKLIRETRVSLEYLAAVHEQARANIPVCPDKFTWIHETFWRDVMEVKASEDCEVATCNS